MVVYVAFFVSVLAFFQVFRAGGWPSLACLVRLRIVSLIFWHVLLLSYSFRLLGCPLAPNPGASLFQIVHEGIAEPLDLFDIVPAVQGTRLDYAAGPIRPESSDSFQFLLTRSVEIDAIGVANRSWHSLSLLCLFSCKP